MIRHYFLGRKRQLFGLYSSLILLLKRLTSFPRKGRRILWEVDQARIGYEKPNESAILVDVRMLRTRDWLIGAQLSITIPHSGYSRQTQIDEVRELAPGVMNVKSYPMDANKKSFGKNQQGDTTAGHFLKP